MTALFDEVQFPPAISKGSKGGPTRSTQVVVMGSGYEARNARWLNSRRAYDAVYGMHSMNDLDSVLQFWEARNGQLIGFRWKDWADYKSCPPDNAVAPTDQLVIQSAAVGSQSLQLLKAYTSGGRTYTRLIKKPVAGTVRVAFNSVETHSFTVDTTTGLITVNPGAGVQVTAGFEFDTPARFNTDNLQISLDDINSGRFPSVPVIEIFL